MSTETPVQHGLSSERDWKFHVYADVFMLGEATYKRNGSDSTFHSVRIDCDRVGDRSVTLYNSTIIRVEFFPLFLAGGQS